MAAVVTFRDRYAGPMAACVRRCGGSEGAARLPRVMIQVLTPGIFALGMP